MKHTVFKITKRRRLCPIHFVRAIVKRYGVTAYGSIKCVLTLKIHDILLQFRNYLLIGNDIHHLIPVGRLRICVHVNDIPFSAIFFDAYKSIFRLKRRKPCVVAVLHIGCVH